MVKSFQRLFAKKIIEACAEVNMQKKSGSKLNAILKYVSAAILLAVPLYPKFPLIAVSGTYVSVRLEDWLLLLTALTIFFSVGKVKNLFKNKVVRAILIYLLAGFLSLISAVWITSTASLLLGFLHWARRIEYFMPILLGILVLKRRATRLTFILKVLMLTIFAAFLYGLGQKYLAWPIIITQNSDYARGVALRFIAGGHINSTFAGHYDLGSFMVLTLPIIVCLFMLVNDLKTKICLGAIFMSGLWLLSFSGSRISVVSYLISVVISLMLIKRYKMIPLVIFLSILAFSTSSNLLARYTRIIEVTLKKINILSVFPKSVAIASEEEILKVKQRYTPIPTPTPVFEDRSTSIRLNVEWPRALRALNKNPVLGTGYSSITLATDNDYLRALGEVGFLGFTALILILARVGQTILKAFPLNQKFESTSLAFVAGTIGAIPGVLINAFFIDIFEASKFAIIFWFFIGLLLYTIRNHKFE